MKPVIVFDLGKTLVDFDYSIAAGRIASRCNPVADAAKFFSLHAALLTSYEMGLLTTIQFYEQIKAASGFCGTQVEFGEFFADIFAPIQPMIDLHAEFRKKKMATFVLSNTNDLAIEHIRKKFPFFNDFDGYVLSYEHGFMKPGSKLYEIVERASGRKGEEVCFIDDRPENVQTGAARGWKTILHEDPLKTREALKKFGLLDQS
jgi:HAD superfamily hydrolase (TIGR01509 family)